MTYTNVQYSKETLNNMTIEDLVAHIEDFAQRALVMEVEGDGVGDEDKNYMDEMMEVAYTRLGYTYKLEL